MRHFVAFGRFLDLNTDIAITDTRSGNSRDGSDYNGCFGGD
jgi:hypothetical protein